MCSVQLISLNCSRRVYNHIRTTMPGTGVGKTLKRCHTPSGEVEVDKNLCVKGGLYDDWVLVPIEEHDNVQCVRVTAWLTTWLTCIAFGQKTGDTESKCTIQWAIDHCRSKLRVTAFDKTPVTEAVSVHAAAILNAESSDDEDVASKADDDDTQSSSTSKCPTTWCCIESDQGAIECKAAARGNYIFIKCDDDAVGKPKANSLKNFINLVISFKAQRKNAAGRVVFPWGQLSGGIVPDTLLRTDDKGKITFDFRKQSWCVRYHASPENKQKRVHYSGLQVGEDLHEMTNDEFSCLLKDKLTKARMIWNAYDKSNSARLSNP